LKNSTVLICFIWVIVFLSPHTADAQKLNHYSVDRPPSLTCSIPVLGSELKVWLNGAAPNAMIWLSLSPASKDMKVMNEIVSLAPGGFDFSIAIPYTADFQGRHFFRIPLHDRKKWVGKTICLEVLVENKYRFRWCFKVENPFIRLAGHFPDHGGMISRYDELARTVIPEFRRINGRPLKVISSRDLQKAYIMLDGDRIAAYDYFSKSLIHEEKTAVGLIDVALTPDGRKLIALTAGENLDESHVPPIGALWIYDLSKRHFTLMDKVQVGLIAPGGVGNYLEIVEDSTLVFIRQANLVVGEYNLITGGYQMKRLGRIEHSGGEIQSLKVYADMIMALMILPDSSAILAVVNTQNYEDRYIPVGRNPKGIKFLHYPNRLPEAFILGGEDSTEDVLWRVDPYTDQEARRLSIPDIAVDFDISGYSDKGLILYNEGEGKVIRFFSLNKFKLLPKEVYLDMVGDSQLYLSRSAAINTGYVSSRGAITIIDLDELDVNGKEFFEGIHSGQISEEIY